MHKFCPLASGSKGNALYLGTDETKLLIDVGISYKALGSKLGEIDVDLGEIDAILITHEHGDHIRGLGMVARKLGIPVFANSETAKAILNEVRDRPKFKIFSTGESFEYGDIEIHPFSIQHDTMDPVAFTLKMAGIKVGVCADLGFVSTLMKSQQRRRDRLSSQRSKSSNRSY